MSAVPERDARDQSRGSARSENYAKNEKKKSSSNAEETLKNDFYLLEDEQLIFKIRITCDDDIAMQQQCDASTLAALQDEVTESFKRHLGRNIYVRVSFHKGSLIILTSITAATMLFMTTPTFRLIRQDISNISRKIFSKMSNINVEAAYKTAKKTIEIVADVVSIISKLITILSGANLPSLPISLSAGHWSSI